VGQRIRKHQDPTEKNLVPDFLQLDWNLQGRKWVRGDRATVRKVTSHLSLSGECLLLFSVEELAKKKGVRMAQIAVAWGLKRVTAPIVGTTKVENLEEMVGERNITCGSPLRVLIKTAAALDVELTEEEAKHLEEPYLPNAVIGHV
jgi:aryl-alcohol dehydrogenase-like predicted oxidoreductase